MPQYISHSNTEQPILFLLEPVFEDAAHPGQRFFCRYCQLIEGVLASFPALLEQVEIRHVGFPRPRQELIALMPEEDQSLPKLVLPVEVRSAHASGEYGGRHYVSGSDAILATLADLYDIPVAHP